MSCSLGLEHRKDTHSNQNAKGKRQIIIVPVNKPNHPRDFLTLCRQTKN